MDGIKKPLLQTPNNQDSEIVQQLNVLRYLNLFL